MTGLHRRQRLLSGEQASLLLSVRGSSGCLYPLLLLGLSIRLPGERPGPAAFFAYANECPGGANAVPAKATAP
ncbi:hypothetical protein [Pseudomonas sp. S2_C03]